MGDYVKIVTQNKNYIVLSSMKAFISRLPENQFVRIHKSYIINLKKVINHDSNNVFIDGKILPLSRNKKLIFKENFAKYQ
jgi:DNA-binding LytR/AlgR family response regulator